MPPDHASDQGILPLSTMVSSSRSFHRFSLDYSLGISGAEAAHEKLNMDTSEEINHDDVSDYTSGGIRLGVIQFGSSAR